MGNNDGIRRARYIAKKENKKLSSQAKESKTKRALSQNNIKQNIKGRN